TGPAGAAGGGPDIGRGTIQPDTFKGSASIYGYLGKATGAPSTPSQDPLSLPLELRPEAPLVAVVSGEYDNGNGKGTQPLTNLENALKVIPSIKDVRPNNYSTVGAKYTETPLIYTYQGEPAK